MICLLCKKDFEYDKEIKKLIRKEEIEQKEKVLGIIFI
jgi:hypothetical protein